MPVTRNRSNCTERSQAAASAAAEDISRPKDSSENDETSTETELPRPDSPDNCSICLGPFSNKSFTSSCAHSFCFICLKQWSKVKAECPLCKQAFTSIFHSIRSNDSYDIYELPPVNPPHQFDYGHFYNYMGGNLSTYASTHHYVSFPQPRLDADLTLSNFSRFQFRNRRYDRYFNPVPGEHQYSFSSASFNPSSHVSAASWPAGAEAFRLQVYRYHMGPPTVVLGCENSTYRLTPAMVNASAHRMQRIMPWLTRELKVLLKSPQSVSLAISIIQPLLSQVTIDSGFFRDRVSPLIGHRSGQFIQECIAFTNSALSMQAFDRKAMYKRRAYRFWDENTSSSSSDDDDVVEITNISPDDHIPDVTASSSNTAVNLQRARWDSPTPGPSWEIMDTNIPLPHLESDRVSVSSESDPVFQPHMNDSDDDSSDAGSDIVFVKFDKPWHERSPIKLSSDSEGDGQSRKHKKLKHKKKQRETLDTSIEPERKRKKHKSLKSRSKERVKLSVSNSDDELEQGAEVNVSVSLASDKHTSKKRRRSKDKNDDARRHKKSDRELVDRLFAEALTQQQNVNTFSGSSDANIPSSSKSRDRSTGKSSGNERHRRKRKKRSRSSASPSVLSSYKKHHSGHKRSSDKRESEKRKHKRKRKSKEHAASEHTDRTSLEKESHVSRNQPPANAGHSLASTLQTSYVAGADNVQHIPLKLWVTTWPTLHVTHKFPAHSASASFPSSSLAQSLPTTSGFSSHRLNYSLSEHTNSAMNSQTISSDSQSSSDSETGHHPGEHVRHVPDCSRTRQWLDVNFSDMRQQPPVSSSLQTTSETPNSVRNGSIQTTTQPTTNTFPDACDVVSVASGDEDIFVSSSASSTKSDSADVSAIENCDLPVGNTPISSHNNSYAESSVAKQVFSSLTCSRSMPSAEKEKRRKLHSVSSKNISSPSCSSFQPFKLHKKSTLAKQNVNPIFSRIAQNFDDDDDSDQPGNANHSIKLHTSDQEKTSSIHNTLRNSSIDGNFKATLTSSKRLQNSASSFNSSLQAIVSSADTTLVLGRGHRSCLKPGEQNVTKASTSSSSSSSASGSVFSMLPPLPTLVTTAVSPTLTSNLSYLPYSPLPVSSTPLSPILPRSVPFDIPQAQLPSMLPLNFPYPSMPSTSPTISPAAYARSSQDACDTAASSKSLAVRKGTKSSSQLLPTFGKFGIDNESKTEFATFFNYKETNGSEGGSYSPEKSSRFARKLTSEMSDNETFLSSLTQGMGETDELVGTP